MKTTKEDFFTRAQAWLPDLQAYVAARLKGAQAKGLVPENMYSSSDLSDAVLLELFEENESVEDDRSVKMRAFAKARKKLDELLLSEDFVQKKIPLGEILDDELRLMDETFSIDGDGDLLPLEELDDISYHQQDYKPQVFLLTDDTRQQIYRALGISEETANQTTDKWIEHFLSGLPAETRSVFELHTLGRLSTHDIADLLSVEEKTIERALICIRHHYKSFVKSYS